MAGRAAAGPLADGVPSLRQACSAVYQDGRLG